MINKSCLYLCLPINFVLVLPGCLHMAFGWPWILPPLLYYAVILGIYSVLSYKMYPKVPGRVLFSLNILNLLFSLLLNQIPNRFLEHWYWTFYALNSNQHLLVLWFMLLAWQCLIRFGALVVRSLK